MLLFSALVSAKEYPVDYMDAWYSKKVDFSKTEWIISHPAANRIFLIHQKQKIFAMITEQVSLVSVEKMDEYFSGPFTEEALRSREKFLRKEKGVLDLDGGSSTHQGIRYGGVGFKVAMDEGVARFHERMWGEKGRLWHISFVSFESSSQDGAINGELNYLMEKVSETPVKTSSFFNLLIPEAQADERCRINEDGSWRQLSSIIPKVKKASACNNVNIAQANRGNRSGIKLDLSSLSGCVQGPPAAWNAMKQGFLSGLNTLANATEKRIEQMGCERLKPPKAKGFWESVGNSYAMQAYSDCLQAAATGALVSQAYQAVKSTLSGIKDLYNWVRAGNNPWSAAVAIVSKEVNGFMCLNAAAQAKVVCEYATHFFIAMGVVVATAATGGALAPVAGAGAAARIAIATQRGVAAAKAFIATPYTVTRTIVKAPAKVVRRAGLVVTGGNGRRVTPAVTQAGRRPAATPVVRATPRVKPKPKPRPQTRVVPAPETGSSAVAELNRRSLLETKQRTFDQTLAGKDLDTGEAAIRIREVGIENFLEEQGDLFAASEKTRLTALYRDINPSAPDAIPSPALIVTERHPDDILRNVIGDNFSLEDKEAFLDIISNRLSDPDKRAQYFRRREHLPGFRERFEALEVRLNADPKKNEYLASIEKYGANRVARGNAATESQINDLESRRLITHSDIDCNTLNQLYPGSFPSKDGLCKRVKFNDDVKGEYCSCGNLKKSTFNFILKCPGNSKEYSTLSGFVDEVALPSTSLPQMCSRIDIPKDKECYMGSTSVAFAGYGGAVQVLCMNSDSSSWGPEDLKFKTDNGIQAGGPQISPSRWSPFSTFPGFQKVIEIASRKCPDVCSPADLAEIQARYTLELNRLKGTSTDPTVLRRIAMEEETFQAFISDLEVGRRTYPSAPVVSSRLPSVMSVSVVDESTRFADLRRAANLTEPERFREASTLLNRPLTPAQEIAIREAHEIGADKGHGFFTYTSKEIARKGVRLKNAGFSSPEIRILMEKGITGKLSEAVSDATFSGVRADDLAKAITIRSARENGSADLSEYNRTRIASAQSYRTAGTESPILLNESARQYILGGDANSASQVLDQGIRSGMDPTKVLAGYRDELKRKEAMLRITPNDPVLKQEVVTRLKVVTSLETKYAPKKAPELPKPSQQMKPQQQSKTQQQAQQKSPQEISPSEAINVGNRLRLGGKAEEASHYYLRGASERKFSDRNFLSAFEESMKGEGTVARQMLAEVRTSSGSSKLNEFIYEIYERDLYRSPNPVHRANVNKLLKEIMDIPSRDRGLFTPQENMMRAMLSATSN